MAKPSTKPSAKPRATKTRRSAKPGPVVGEGGLVVPPVPEMIDPGLVDPPTPTPAPWAAGPEIADPQTPASTPSAIAVGQLNGHNTAAITKPRSLIWSGVLGLTVAVAGLLMIGWRRRQW